VPRPSRSASDPAREVGFGEALAFWTKLGFISFGGPAGQIAIMHRELVERRRWISETRFLHALNYCMLLPGPEAQQLATYTGWLLHGTRGGLAAGLLFVLPSIFVLLGLSYLYAAYGDLSIATGMLSGFKAVVVAIVAEAVLRIGRRAIHGWPHFLVAAAAFAAIHFLGIPFPFIVLAAALAGLAGVKMNPEIWAGRTAASPRDSVEDSIRARAGDSRPAAEPALRWAARTLAVCLALWLVPAIALGAWLGLDTVPARQYGFFTVAAFVTFGGAYAVLAYVTQAAVHAYHWITPAQAVDGLALAETTPGPLIMVLQFVGFMTGWNHPGSLSPVAAATLGAAVTTWVTFLPCFLFVFVGAPYIEKLRGNRALNGALSGVTASVIGVVLSLALFFGTAVILPRGIAGGVNWFAALLAGAAFAALSWKKIDALWIVIAGGLAGLARMALTN